MPLLIVGVVVLYPHLAIQLLTGFHLTLLEGSPVEVLLGKAHIV
jgi:hypothetical protein